MSSFNRQLGSLAVYHTPGVNFTYVLRAAFAPVGLPQ